MKEVNEEELLMKQVSMTIDQVNTSKRGSSCKGRTLKEDYIDKKSYLMVKSVNINKRF